MGSSGGGGGIPATTVTGPDAFGAAAVIGTSTRYARQDHDHGLPAAPATGASFTAMQRANTLAESFPRFLANSDINILTLGQLFLSPIIINSGTVIGHIAFCSGTTAASAPTHWWFGLWDNNFAQLATTADQTSTAWAANTEKSLAVATIASGASSTFTTTYTGLHYAGVLFAGSTQPTLACSPSGGLRAELNLTPVLGGGSTGALTTPPAFPATATTPTNGDSRVYAYVAT